MTINTQAFATVIANASLMCRGAGSSVNEACQGVFVFPPTALILGLRHEGFPLIMHPVSGCPRP